MKAPVLVTGGAGFIGSHLVQRLVDEGQHVRVLERPLARVSHLPLDHIELVRCDIRDRAAVAQAVRHCREVYHLAANPQLWTQRRGEYSQVNFLGAVNVLEEALAAGVRRIVHVSTESILTLAHHNGPIGRDQNVRLTDAVGPYCRSKLLAERHALALARQGAGVIVVNPTLPIGPGDWGLSPPTQMMLDFCRGRRREYLDADLNLVDVLDVSKCLVLAMRQGVPGRRYLLGGENLSIRALFEKLASLTGLPPPSRRVPYGLALAAAYFSEWLADVWTHRPPAATVTGVKLTQRRMHFEAGPSLAELGLKPRPIDEGLRSVVDWFRTNGWITERKNRQVQN